MWLVCVVLFVCIFKIISQVYRLMDTRLWISSPSKVTTKGVALHQDLQGKKKRRLTIIFLDFLDCTTLVSTVYELFETDVH